MQNDNKDETKVSVTEQHDFDHLPETKPEPDQTVIDDPSNDDPIGEEKLQTKINSSESLDPPAEKDTRPKDEQIPAGSGGLDETSDLSAEQNDGSVNEEETQVNTMTEPSHLNALDEHTEENTFDENPGPANNLQRDTIFGDDAGDKAALAEINFDLVDAGRWLLKVIAGPNNGAEFSMHSSSSYVIGTDPTSCDIVFHDTSVSRQHARVTLAADDGMTIEDLKSRNQTIVDGEPIKSKTKLLPNGVVTVGTTSFTIYDREGEMQTIISPLMPAIVKVLQKEEPKPLPPVAPENEMPPAPAVEPPPVSLAPLNPPPEKTAHALGAFIVMGILSGLFVIIGIGTASLFRSEPVVVEQETNTAEILNNALKPFPSITPFFNKPTGTLQLIGHVLTQADKQRLYYSLQGIPFIKNIDDSKVIIDEYVWQETNAVLSKDPTWKGIYVQATSPGKFVLSGYLQTRNQADQLSEYMANNFPYLDLLEKSIIVEEDVVNKANSLLTNAGFRDIAIKMENGEVTLTGGYPNNKEEEFQNTLTALGEIAGVRNIKNLAVKQAPDQSIINISDRYEVTGFSKRGATYSIVVHGRILTTGDEIDGMQITDIKSGTVMLQKDNVKYRIDFSR